MAESGIYEIRNRVNGKRYVGSAVSIKNRWREHRRDLASGKHHCLPLLRSWQKYGQDAFEFLVIEECAPIDLIEREQVAFDHLKPDYNVCGKAGSSLGLKHSSETRKRMSQAQKARFSDGQPGPTKGWRYPPEVCERMAAPKRGRKRGPMSEQTKLKLSAAKKGKSVNFGRVASESTKEKLRQANLGKRQSVEIRLKRCTLTDEQVRQTRQLRAAGSTYHEIASETGIDRRHVGKICRRERYEWIDQNEPVPEIDRSRGWKYSDQGRINRSAQMKSVWAKRKAEA